MLLITVVDNNNCNYQKIKMSLPTRNEKLNRQKKKERKVSNDLSPSKHSK